MLPITPNSIIPICFIYHKMPLIQISLYKMPINIILLCKMTINDMLNLNFEQNAFTLNVYKHVVPKR